MVPIFTASEAMLVPALTAPVAIAVPMFTASEAMFVPRLTAAVAMPVPALTAAETISIVVAGKHGCPFAFYMLVQALARGCDIHAEVTPLKTQTWNNGIYCTLGSRNG